MRRNSSKRLQAEAMSEWQGMRKQPNTKLRDLLKPDKKVGKALHVKETCYPHRSNQYNVCNESQDALNNALKCILTTFKNQSLKVFNGTDD